MKKRRVVLLAEQGMDDREKQSKGAVVLRLKGMLLGSNSTWLGLFTSFLPFLNQLVNVIAKLAYFFCQLEGRTLVCI